MTTPTPSTNDTSLPATGSWVQYNVTTQSPLSGMPTSAEQTIGLVRSVFTSQGNQFAQVVWNPGSQNPQTGLYTAEQLCQLNQQQANDIRNQMSAGTFQPSSGTPSSNYQQPSVPTLALPSTLQEENVTPTLTGPTNEPLSPGTGYQ
jgi:hypothetical protein